MLFDLSIIPLRGKTRLSEEIAEIVNIIEESGLPYQLTPSSTCIEGDWSEVMAVVRHCHEHIRKKSAHVITTIKIEDEEDSEDKLTKNVTSVQDKMKV